MNIGKIDKGLEEIIHLLDESGFKPFGSCDGINANHDDVREVTNAYIAFMESDRIIDLMAAFMKDREFFEVSFSNNTHFEPYQIYGNTIFGNIYNVSFENHLGQKTEYFNNIIRGIIDGRIQVDEEEKERLIRLNDVLKDENGSDLNFDVTFRYDGITGKYIMLTVNTKASEIQEEYYRDLTSLYKILRDKFGFALCDLSQKEQVQASEYVNTTYSDTCKIAFDDSHIDKLIEVIKFFRDAGVNLHKVKRVEINDYPDEFDDSEL